jgi:hypothetical protein
MPKPDSSVTKGPAGQTMANAFNARRLGETPYEPDAPELKDRRDLASQATGFHAWLREQKKIPESPFRELADIVWDAGVGKFFDLKAWGEALEAHVTDPELLEEIMALLIRAEAEWRVDREARERARISTGVGGSIEEISLSHRLPAPVDASKCGYKDRGGKSCFKPTVPGSDRCPIHGGAVIDPETRRSMLVSAYATIVEGAEKAVTALVDIAERGRNELARVNAAREILDRAGLTAALQVNVTHSVPGQLTPTEALSQRLDAMRDGLTKDVIEASILDEQPVATDQAVPLAPDMHPHAAARLREAAERIMGDIIDAPVVEADVVDITPAPAPAPALSVPTRVVGGRGR